VLLVACQNVRRQPGRFAASASAVAVAVVLAVFVVGLYVGLLESIIEYPASLPADVVVAEEGASVIMIRSSSRLAADAERRVAALPGVASVTPLHGRMVWLDVAGHEALAFLVGLYTTDAVGGPPRTVAGRARPKINEIVIDRVLAHELRLGVGDTIEQFGVKLRVGGIAAGGNAMVGTYAFVHRGALLMAGVGSPSYLLVRTAPGADPAAVAAAADALPGIAAYTRERFLRKNQALARQVVMPLITVILVVSLVIGGAFAALTLYTQTVERRREYGTLLAVGLSRRQVYATVLLQSGIVTAVGLVVGLGAAYGLAALLSALVPRYATSVPLGVTAAIAAATAVVGLATALVPVRLLARLEVIELMRA
jgi:putative ABC transport system permease protein